MTLCPWTIENPRHDHQLVFPMRDGSLLLAWCEYYVRKPSRIAPVSTRSYFLRDDSPCRISGKLSRDGGRNWSGKITLQENFGLHNVKHPNLLRLPSGEVLFTFTVHDMTKRDLRIYLKRSNDECETWTKPVRISPAGRRFLHQRRPHSQAQFGSYHPALALLGSSPIREGAQPGLLSLLRR